MKFLLTTFLIIFFIGAFAQTPNLPIDSITNLITYTEVVKADSNQAELYSRAREWFAKAYKSSTNVIQMDDKENGKIIGKALMQVYFHSLGSDHESGYINYTILVYLKDKRYKYEINNFYHTGQYNTDGNRVPDFGTCEEMLREKRKARQKTFNYFLKQMDENIKALIVSMKESMAKKSSVTKDDF